MSKQEAILICADALNRHGLATEIHKDGIYIADPTTATLKMMILFTEDGMDAQN